MSTVNTDTKKRAYSAPLMHVVMNAGNLSNEQMINLSIDEMESYMNQCRQAEYAMRFKANPNFLCRQVADEALLVPVGPAAQYFNGMISIDEVSYFLWQHLQEYTTIPQLISQAQQEYNDPKGLMELDVREYIFGFLNNNLIIKEK